MQQNKAGEAKKYGLSKILWGALLFWSGAVGGRADCADAKGGLT